MFELSRAHTASFDRGRLIDNVGRYLPTKNLAGAVLIIKFDERSFAL